MKNAKFKIALCMVFFSFVFFTVFQFRPIVKGQNSQSNSAKILKPETATIDKFDSLIQNRFLTEPFFGMRRIQPLYPTNPHFEYFAPKNEAETEAVKAFTDESWKTSMYLFGRTATPIKFDKEKPTKFSIKYRLFDAMPVTHNLEKKDTVKSAKLLNEVKQAFIEFQKPNSPNENSYQFNFGGWSFVAKPVRAVNETCVSCHRDYVVLERKGKGKFSFRPRQIGDANGVLVYGFKKAD